MFVKPSHILSELQTIRNEAFTAGVATGWGVLDSIYTPKPGTTLYVAGYPHDGKTELTLDLLVNLSRDLGWKHFIYLGENGGAGEIFAEIAHKIIGKPYRKMLNRHDSNPFCMTESERIYAEQFIDESFVVLDPEALGSKIDDFTVKEFYNLAQLAEKEYDIKFNTTLIDPFNDVKEEVHEHGGRDDLWLNDCLKTVRVNAKKNNRLNIIINHVADIKAVTDKDTGMRYLPVPLPTEWARGRTWHRRAMTMLCVYRPKPFMKDEHGSPVAENETWVFNQKAKPKGTGKIGFCSLFWDWKKNRFYEQPKEPVIFPGERSGDEF